MVLLILVLVISVLGILLLAEVSPDIYSEKTSGAHSEEGRFSMRRIRKNFYKFGKIV